MTCRERESSLIELARHGLPGARERTELTAHLEQCVACQTTLEKQIRLTFLASALASEAAGFTAPLSVERALLREIDSRRRLQGRQIAYTVFGAAIAASLMVAFWPAAKPAPTRVIGSGASVAAVTPAILRQPQEMAVDASPSAVPKRPRRVKPPAAEPEQPFIAIPYTLPLEPYERADVVRMELPVAALIAAGVPTDMMDPGARAQTEVLVGQDGLARAIRLISISTSN